MVPTIKRKPWAQGALKVYLQLLRENPPKTWPEDKILETARELMDRAKQIAAGRIPAPGPEDEER